MPRPREPRKIKLCVTLKPSVRTTLAQMAAQKGRSVSQVFEDLVVENEGLEEYFHKQAAFHGFMAAAVSAALAHKVLGPQATMALQEQAAKTARRLYGRSPTRDFSPPPGWGFGFWEDDDDPRVWALFSAYGTPTPF